MQNINFISTLFLLLIFIACQIDKPSPCTSADFDIQNINQDKTQCEISGLCQGSIDSMFFNGKVLAFLEEDSLISFTFFANHKNYDYTLLSFSVDLKKNSLIDSTFYAQIKRNEIEQAIKEKVKVGEKDKIYNDCFEYDKKLQVIKGSLGNRKILIRNIELQLSNFSFKASTKPLKSPCVLCG